jgi:hypothetical protein
MFRVRPLSRGLSLTIIVGLIASAGLLLAGVVMISALAWGALKLYVLARIFGIADLQYLDVAEAFYFAAEVLIGVILFCSGAWLLSRTCRTLFADRRAEEFAATKEIEN